MSKKYFRLVVGSRTVLFMVVPCEARAPVKLIQVRYELSGFIVCLWSRSSSSHPPTLPLSPSRRARTLVHLSLPSSFRRNKMIIANVHATTSYTNARNESVDWWIARRAQM